MLFYFIMIEQSGYLHTLTAEQRAIVLQVREHLETNHSIANNPRWTDWNILRFCRARKFKYPEIITMINNFLKWFKENNYDNIGDVEISKFAQLRQLTCNGYYNTDKFGRPIYIEKVSGLKEKEVFKSYDEPTLALYYV